MRETIATIPVTTIFEKKQGCPICRMYSMLEERVVEFIMGPAMMEPDVRIKTNKQGFCKSHYKIMQERKNVLSLALMLKSHLEKIIQDDFNRPDKFTAKNKTGDSYRTSCYICSTVDNMADRIISTLFATYSDQAQFRKLFDRQEFFCLAHYYLLADRSSKALSKKTRADFLLAMQAINKNYIDRLESDITKFCNMFDYRNANADPGTARDAVERAIAFLTTSTDM